MTLPNSRSESAEELQRAIQTLKGAISKVENAKFFISVHKEIGNGKAERSEKIYTYIVDIIEDYTAQIGGV